MYIILTDIDNIGPKIVPIFQTPSAASTLTRSAGWRLIPNGQAYIPPNQNGIVSY